MKIVNVKDYKVYDLIQEKHINCYSYLEYFSVEYSNQEENEMDLIMLEWEQEDVLIKKYDITKEISQALKYIGMAFAL
jgi:hypothetical protein